MADSDPAPSPAAPDPPASGFEPFSTAAVTDAEPFPVIASIDGNWR